MKGVRWSEKDKAFALSIFHASPKAYRLLKKQFLLPSIKTLQRTVQNANITPGFNNNILQALSLKVKSLPPHSEACVLVFDEMAIKECVSYDSSRDRIEGLDDFGEGHKASQHVANHATVFMVRGLMTNWKQPVGYFFSSGPMESGMLHLLLLECLEKLEEAGLDVKVVVADQGSNNQRLFRYHLKATADEPFFLWKSKKIHVLPDPPHLLKNIRNNLKKTGFCCEWRICAMGAC